MTYGYKKWSTGVPNLLFVYFRDMFTR